MNFKQVGRVIAVVLVAFLPLSAFAQQTLGSIDGAVTDSSGAVITGAAVKARNVATNLEVTAQTKADGSFHIADLPIGTYEVTFAKNAFKSSVYPQILVQGNRTATINVQLQPGQISTTVTVNATPLLNETDTTTGYVLGTEVIENMPLGTGSFTQLAILSPGVSADLLNTSGTNAGLGNQAIWSNGQRDTSNSFSINAIDANNIFNGKSTSQVASNRVAVNIGENYNLTNGDIQTSTSVYGAIGEAIPSPPVETIQEMRVNSAMYDASQGANSGAHIEVTTKSGTKDYHGGAYEYHQTTGWNANPWFNKQAGLNRPDLHRNVFGGFIGGPIKKDKLFFFASYQGQRVSDGLLGTSLVAVPPDLTDARDATSLANVINQDFGPSCGPNQNQTCTAADINPTALGLMNLKAANGTYFIPSSTSSTPISSFGEVEVKGPPARFTADQVNGNIDYVFSPKDRLAAKYYYQRDPNVSPFSNSNLLGFPQTLHAGSQVISLNNTTILTPNLSWEQRFGFIREKAYGGTSQSLTPLEAGISLLGLTTFPTISIYDADNNSNPLTVGPVSNFANAGIYQNSWDAATNLSWVHGRHTISTGFNWNYFQLNVINKNNQVARLDFYNFPGFLQGQLCGPASSVYCGGQDPSLFLNGATNRYYRAKEAGAYVQDDIRIKPNLSIDIGLRWDWDGPLYEKNGMMTNFYSNNYSYDVATDTVESIGLVVAGNNRAFGTPGVSDSTLKARQWGFAPRIGVVYSPSFLKNVVARAGFGMYYDRGEFFTEFSPPAGLGISGPFGVTTEEPFVVPFYPSASATFAVPFGTTPPPPPPTNLAGVVSLVPNAGQLINQTSPYCIQNNESFCGPLFFGGYDPKNRLPYSENWTLDLQWQPVNSVVASLAYVGNHGVHEVIPIPFNEAQIATPQNPLLASGPFPQQYSYAYNVTSVETAQTIVAGFTAGNVALRSPYIGYDPNSEFQKAVGISNYNALQMQVNKRLSHGLLITGSYTWSHTLDEGSGLGLFFNGNDPNNPRTAYGNSDFDRTHVFTASYLYQFPTSGSLSGWKGQAVNGWGISGVTVLESGQPYSVVGYDGGAGSIYWGAQDEVTNIIIPVGGAGATSKQPILQGTTGVNANKPVLNANAFGIVPPYAPGTNGVPPCDPDGTCDNFETGFSTGGRNIFRGPFQNRWDFGIFKNFKFGERFGLKYDCQFFNIFNHPSFDTPDNLIYFNPDFNNPPVYSPGCIPATGAYQCPPNGHLGLIQHTIGSPRFVQMALHLTF
jgi:hypothetical protein